MNINLYIQLSQKNFLIVEPELGKILEVLVLEYDFGGSRTHTRTRTRTRVGTGTP
jgi:hypothetical protein